MRNLTYSDQFIQAYSRTFSKIQPSWDILETLRHIDAYLGIIEATEPYMFFYKKNFLTLPRPHQNNGIQTHNHLVRKWTLNHLAKLA